MSGTADPAAIRTNILFIGNSFTSGNDVPGILRRLAAAAKPPVVVRVERVIANPKHLDPSPEIVSMLTVR